MPNIRYELALFAGAGGGILGGKLLGWKCIGAVECENYPRGILAQRQNDGHLDPFPIWDDVRTFRAENPDCAPYIEWLRSIRDELVITGGFPCQDISAAGKGAGIEGEKSGLWREMARIIGEIRPARSLVENSPMLTVRGIRRVLGDLAEMGYDAKWGVVSAADAIWLDGTPCIDHLRDRLFIAASDTLREQAHEKCGGSKRLDEIKWDAMGTRLKTIQSKDRETGSNDFGGCDNVPKIANSGKARPKGLRNRALSKTEAFADAPRLHWWASEPQVDRMAHGVADRFLQLGAIGNGQVPRVVKLAWEILNA